MTKEQEKAMLLAEFRTMIGNSWTFERLTEKEKERIMNVLSVRNYQTMTALKGTKQQRWDILNAIYSSFLIALDYKPIGWREKEESEVLF